MTTESVEKTTIRTLMVRYPAGHRLPVHQHGWAQFTYAAEGFLTVQAEDASWVVPAERGVWLPSGTRHSLATRVRTMLHAVYFPPGVAGLGAATTVVQVTPLVRELVRHLVERGTLDLTAEGDARLIEVLFDQLRAIDAAPLELRQPLDGRARDAAERLGRQPAVDLDDLAHTVGVGRRTLERRFRHETGITLGHWRQRAQLLRAVELLAGGATVTTAGAAVGYSTPSAFIAAFRRTLGTTPRQFLRER